MLTRNELYKLEPVILTKGLLMFNNFIRKEFCEDDDQSNDDESSTAISRK